MAEMFELTEAIEKLKEEKPSDIKELQAAITDKEKAVDELLKQLRQLSMSIAEENAHEKAAKTVKDKISTLDKCPMCEQQVGHEHKLSIRKREDEKIMDSRKKMEAVLSREVEIKLTIEKDKDALSFLRKSEAAANLANQRLKQLDEKAAKHAKLAKEQEGLKSEIETLNAKREELAKLVDLNKGVQDTWGKLEKEFSTLLESEKLLQIQNESVRVRMENSRKLIAAFDKEISDKQLLRIEAQKTADIQNWLSDAFISLTAVIEKHVMGQIHREFNLLFTTWFAMLIDDELINARLDDTFTPVIDQNGYETTMENLSGGEKTSVALAYRLALNKVLNDFISHIRTRDIIMLDEPTDGFSSEQLDRMRELLDELAVKQAIIVSHEPKIESFVSSVLRISKDEHVSSC